MKALQAAKQPYRDSGWPVDTAAYDRSFSFSPAEWQELEDFVRRYHASNGHRSPRFETSLQRILKPLSDVFDIMMTSQPLQRRLESFLLREMYRRGTTFWAWNQAFALACGWRITIQR
jgi:hypothetical protein